MKIRKFEGTTEQEVIEMVKDELGMDALILNIKKIQPKGIFSLFRKPTVEITAAYDDKPALKAAGSGRRERPAPAASLQPAQDTEEPDIRENIRALDKLLKERTISDQGEKIKSLEERLSSTEDILQKAIAQLAISARKTEVGQRKYDNNLVQVFYEALLEQGVLAEIAEEILDDLTLIDDEEEIDISLIVKIVYAKVMDILGEPDTLPTAKSVDGEARIAAFIGSTGVGKTTTIAKLSADCILNHKLEVGLITADTYRIAAVEQLKTYAEILGVNVEVMYGPEDLQEYVDIMRSMHDVILLDTAGRSHRNGENLKELAELLTVVPDSQNFLVLSLTTKLEDLLSIVATYEAVADFRLVFTKLDETLQYGSILNVCHKTGRKVSYVTMGQNVPDDIDVVRPEKIAKALLGLEEDR